MVDRCICFSRTFEELKRIAERENASDVATLQTHAEFGQKCGLCKPYVARMLESGRTRFPVMRQPGLDEY